MKLRENILRTKKLMGLIKEQEGSDPTNPDAYPDQDEWGMDDSWSWSEWKTYFNTLKNKYGNSFAKKRFLKYWEVVENSMFSDAKDGMEKSWFEKNGMWNSKENRPYKGSEIGDKVTDAETLDLNIRKPKIKHKLLSSLKLKGRGPEGHYAQIMQMKKDGKGNMDNWESRNGYDLMCEPGTIVKTPIDGIVTSVSVSKSANRSVYGMSIKIKSTDGKDEIFMTHLDPAIPKVTQGQEVKKGDVVGIIGDPIAAGKSFAAHLHVSTKDENHTIFKYINDDMTFTA